MRHSQRTGNIPEMTVRALILGLILAAVFAASNCYLASKVGRTIAGSIPAAVISLAVLRFFRGHHILEHNMVQTAASAGESMSAAVIFTIPALVMFGVWSEFHYWELAILCILGGSIGVFFSVPLRRILVIEEKLPYPEGLAVAELLKVSNDQGKAHAGVRILATGGLTAAVFGFIQSGLKVVGESWDVWTHKLGVIQGVGFGFSPVLVSVGFMVGFEVMGAVFFGNFLNWQILLPVFSHSLVDGLSADAIQSTAMQLYKQKLRYISVGTMTFGGIWGLVHLINPLKKAFTLIFSKKTEAEICKSTEKDIPMAYVAGGLILGLIGVFFVFNNMFASFHLPIGEGAMLGLVVLLAVCVVIIGFMASSVASYITGLVGTTSLPLSGITISSMVSVGVLVLVIFGSMVDFSNQEYALKAAGLTIVFAAVVAMAGTMAGDNMQDLKAGHEVGATPWKQQVMLVLGVAAGALVMAPVLNVLFYAYGMGDILPRPGMDPLKALPVPQATLMATVAKGLFTGKLEGSLFFSGVGIGVIVAIGDAFLKKARKKMRLPVVAVALGMYLPMSMILPMIVGAVLASIAYKGKVGQDDTRRRDGILMASGMIAGESLVGIALAIPFALSPLGDMALSLGLPIPEGFKTVLGLAGFAGICWMLLGTRPKSLA